MKSRASILVLTCVCFVSAVPLYGKGEPSAIELFNDGDYAVTIAMSDDARESDVKAVELLFRTLKQITGVAPAVTRVGADEPLPGRCFVIGQALAKKGGVPLPEDLKSDGFIVRRASDRIVLAGASPLGTYYAAADFLEEELGCRWFSEDRVVIPQQKAVTVTVRNRREEPTFKFRNPYILGVPEPAGRENFGPGWGNSGNKEYSKREDDGNVHSFFQLLPPGKYFRDHPEYYTSNYFSEKDGGMWFHEQGQINYHNQDVRRIIAENVLKSFQKQPHWKRKWVSQQDWFGWNEHPTTNRFDARHGTVAASHVDFINSVATAVARKMPGKKLCTLAYLQTYHVPDAMRYEPNVRLYVCEPDGMWGHAVSDAGRFGREYFQTLKRWAERSDETFTWWYYNFVIPTYHIGPDVAGLQADFQAYRDAGVDGIFGEAYTGQDRRKTREYFGDLRGYLIAKLCWNPDLDYETLIRDFHLNYFGRKSGPKMLEFYKAATDGVVTFEPAVWNDERYEQLERIAKEALFLADDEFARKAIRKSLRAVSVMKMMKLVQPWQFDDGQVKNGYDKPEVKELLGRFAELTRQIGDGHALSSQAIRYEAKTVTLASSEIELTIIPAGGGAVARIIDRQTGKDYAGLNPRRIGDIFVGGYQELAGTQWSKPGIRNAYKVVKESEDSITLLCDLPSKGMRIERTITLLSQKPGFQVDSKVVASSGKKVSIGLRTHPVFQIGDPADVYFAYSNQNGEKKAGLIKTLECFSAGWGPTGMWAMINPKENRGVLWTSPPVHNGHFVWADPFKKIIACETFSQHKDLAAGQALEMTQDFTILRDARKWCEQENIPVPFKNSARRTEKADVGEH